MTADPLYQEYTDALAAYLAEGYGPGVAARLTRVQMAEAALNRRAFDKAHQAMADHILKLLKDSST